ncbi:MAG: B12-binding domain-containing protein [Elusimicrobiota bacterium]
MIRWCAYCQSYLGECAPFDKYSLTHCLCEKCEASGIAEKKDVSERLRPLVAFFEKLRGEVRSGINSPPEWWVKEGFALGIKPEDLLIGIIQPALYEIGELWAQGGATVAAEHRFSSFAEIMVTHVHAHYPELGKNRQAGKPDVLLANIDGNYHTLGVKFLETSLLSAGLKTFTVLPGLPGREILGLISSLRPKVLGLSVSLAPQVRNLRALTAEIIKIPKSKRPLILAGGGPIKKGLLLPPGLDVMCCRNISDFPFKKVHP